MEDKYPTLTLVTTIYKIMGYAVIVISVILAILFWILVSTQQGSNYVPYYIITISLTVGLFGSLIAFTIGKLIQLLMDIEKNTRK